MRHIETVELHNDGSGLGFGIVGGRSTGVIVKTILPRGVADRVCTCIERLTNRSDKGLTLETSAFLPLTEANFVNPVVNTKLPAILSQRRSTTVSLETYPFIHMYLYILMKVMESLIAALGTMQGEMIFIMQPRKGRKLQVV